MGFCLVPCRQMPKAALIVNGKSRRGREWYDQVVAKLQEDGFELVNPQLVREPKTISTRVEEAIKGKIPLVCVGGGDGTFSAVAGKFVGSESVLGVLPLGTGNSLARDLGIKADVDDACRVLTDGVERDIDLGRINDEYFVNVATVGLTTRIAEALDDEAKKRWGRFVYFSAIVKAVASLKPFKATLELPGGTQEMQAVQVVIGNGRFHGGPFPITPDAEIESGKLAGYVLTDMKKGTLLRYAMHLWGGRQVEMPEVVTFEVETVGLETSPGQKVTVDGEVGMKTPIKLAVLPHAIRVMTPKESKSRFFRRDDAG